MIESLESRIAPAGIIDVLFTGGALTLKPLPAGDGAEVLAIKNGLNPNDYVLDPEPGTKLRVNGVELADGEAYSVPNITGLISVSLGAGGDRLTAENTHFIGGLKIDLGSGNNHAYLNGLAAASLSCKGGANDDAVELNGAKIGGAVTLDLGAGRNDSYLGSGTVIAGDLTVRGGAGIDEINSSNVNPDGVHIAGKFTANLGGGENLVSLGSSTNVGRDLLIITGKGADKIGFGQSGDQAIGGSVIVNSGTGADSVALSTGGYLHIGKNLSITSGGALGGIIEQRVEAKTDLSIGGTVSFKSGVGKAVIQDVRGKSGSTGAVALTGGTDIDLAFNGDIHGAVKVIAAATAAGGHADLGSANSKLRIQGALTVDLNSAAGDMANAVNLSTVTVNLGIVLLGGEGRDHFIFEDVTALGAVKIDAGAGADDLVVESLNALPGPSDLLGTFTFKGGAGDDHVEWSSGTATNHAITATKLVTFDGGAGTDTANVGSGATFFVPLRTVSFT